MALPKLPGYDFNTNFSREKFHKSHHFDQANEVSLMVGENKPGIGGVPLAGQKLGSDNTVYHRGEGSSLPSWVAFDKQVLSFDGYFQEAVVEKREEQYRIRPVKIYFYLEDDSVQVEEIKVKNSQLPQGTLIRRHRIPRPKPRDDEHYIVDDFNVGVELDFYGRRFKLTDCDEFTKNFLTKIGMRTGQQESIPKDPYREFRKAMDESMQPLRPYERQDTLKQFLDHDRHVLRFFGFWDDEDSMFGDRHDLVIHYFLADDTIEIREIIPPNAGRDATPCFLRRGKLPKYISAHPAPGQITDRTVLNVFGPMGHGGRYILDSLKTGHKDIAFYKEDELKIGGVLNAYGRKIVLTDCDDFTKYYYKEKYGIEKMEPIDTQPPMTEARKAEYPPYHGFGSEEDSLTSCQPTLQPKPPQKDFVKFMAKDRCGLESNILRFHAKMITNKAVDQDRRFIISYFLSDDTILVFEPPQRNSGHQGGKFLERQRIVKPNQPRFSTTPSEYFMASDFHIGAIVSLNNFQFEIIDADEYALAYLESKMHHMPSDVRIVIDKLKGYASQNTQSGLEEKFTSVAKGGTTMHYGQLKELLTEVSNGQLTEHEILVIARHFGQPEKAGIDIGLFTYIAQEFLRKNNFDIHMNRVPEALLQRDAAKCDHLPKIEILTCLKSIHIPIPRDQLTLLVENLPENEQGHGNYRELLRILNWKQNPVACPPNFQAGDVEDPMRKINVEEVKRAQERICYIDYKQLYDIIKPGTPQEHSQRENSTQ